MPTHVSHQKYLLKSIHHVLITDINKSIEKGFGITAIHWTAIKKHARFLLRIHYFSLLIKKHKIASVHLMFTKEQIHMGETQCKNTLIYRELFITIHGNKKDTSNQTSVTPLKTDVQLCHATKIQENYSSCARAKTQCKICAEKYYFGTYKHEKEEKYSS